MGTPWIVKFELRSPSEVVGLLMRPPNWRMYVARNWLMVVELRVSVLARLTLCWLQVKSRSTHGMLPPPESGCVSVPFW